jgi:hypothetical protein
MSEKQDSVMETRHWLLEFLKSFVFYSVPLLAAVGLQAWLMLRAVDTAGEVLGLVLPINLGVAIAGLWFSFERAVKEANYDIPQNLQHP